MTRSSTCRVPRWVCRTLRVPFLSWAVQLCHGVNILGCEVSNTSGQPLVWVIHGSVQSTHADRPRARSIARRKGIKEGKPLTLLQLAPFRPPQEHTRVPYYFLIIGAIQAHAGRDEDTQHDEDDDEGAVLRPARSPLGRARLRQGASALRRRLVDRVADAHAFASSRQRRRALFD